MVHFLFFSVNDQDFTQRNNRFRLRKVRKDPGWLFLLHCVVELC